jgi:hypothetical protein
LDQLQASQGAVRKILHQVPDRHLAVNDERNRGDEGEDPQRDLLPAREQRLRTACDFLFVRLVFKPFAIENRGPFPSRRSVFARSGDGNVERLVRDGFHHRRDRRGSNRTQRFRLFRRRGNRQWIDRQNEDRRAAVLAGDRLGVASPQSFDLPTAGATKRKGFSSRRC